ncbi:MAG: hypothetical protein SGI73_19950 [Chloroflexota bacterium]|nr:hypothetical protein [Chloroflexota bacterium]
MDSGFNDFFGQLPSIFILIFCGSGAALLGVVVYLIVNRRLKAGANPNASATGQRFAAEASPYANAPAAQMDMGDFPDLDDLLTSTPIHKPHSGTFTVALSDGGAVEVAEVLSVLRDVADGGLIIQIGDKAYRHPATRADAEFTRRYTNALRDLNAGNPATPAAPPMITPTSAPPPAYAPPMITPTSAPPIAAQTPAYADDLPEIDLDFPEPELFDLPPPAPLPLPIARAPATEMLPAVPGDLPKFRMPDKPEPPKRGRRTAPDRTPIPEINIAAAIETYLQHKMVNSPFARRSIHIRAAPHGGVVIEVDGSFYDAVGDVTDDATRTFIASAIEEWQSRQ